MTVNYCGTCGAANGAAASFCRHCGAELKAQESRPAQNPVAPENSARRREQTQEKMQEKKLQPETQSQVQRAAARRAQEQNAPPPGDAAAASDARAAGDSLRKLRTSGPLTVAAAKAQKESPPRTIMQSLGRQSGKPVPPVAPAQASVAPAVGAVPSSVAPKSVTRPDTGSLPSGVVTGALVANPLGPADALTQASGLTPQPQAGRAFLLGALALALLLAVGGYIFYRAQGAAFSAGLSSDVRNLVSSEEQSSRLIQLGRQYRAENRYDEAAEHFQRAINLSPNDPQPRFLLAQTYAAAGKDDEALRAYDSFLRLTVDPIPEHLDARLQMAQIYRARGRWDEAYQQFQRVISLDQSSPQAAVALEIIEAHDDAEPAKEPTPNDPPRLPRVRRAVAPKRIGPVLPPTVVARNRLPLLVPAPNVIPGLRPPANFGVNRPSESPDPRLLALNHKELGSRYFNIRQYRAALSELLSAQRLTPWDKDLYYLIGSSYHGLNQYVQAYEYYKKCDGGVYAPTAQSALRNVEKLARKEFERKQSLNNVNSAPTKPTDAPKGAAGTGKAFSNTFQEPEQ